MSTTVLLVNFGGPRTLDEVPLFLRNMTGRPMPRDVEEAVSERYRAIGGGSPLAAITEEQAALLTDETGGTFVIKSAFRYTSPSLEERINECYRAGIERIAFLAMSPYYASRTTGVYRTAAESYLASLPYSPETVFVHSWHDEPRFIDSWVERIKSADPPEKAFYIFSAHSLPESLSGEPYRRQVEETAHSVAERLAVQGRCAVAWQSVPQNADVPWMGPSVEATMDSLAGRLSSLVEVPIGFVSDHLETLYDMDILHRQHALSKGFDFFRIPSLNTYPPFIRALKAVIERHLGAGR